MAPKGRGLPGGRAPAQQGFASTAYQAITSSDNRSVVTSIAFFAAGVAFLSSSWSEFLLPPL
ncbi:uncharacterized protein K489DRAFT_376376 [Dissoconium aciculare CBS 342.82]|uniref:TOM core complex subunit Tom6 n=1 Tax=Dissoconium aciculare CBS 342.82 TaxID=1314786 RepID=A0A6J3MDM7_9PEZI|nr:uncharacterized protein K489DRAFT_376376 [Dissoconium aciculare CBS 342.82]KAF1825983.1 hypothetical protein K489DRAFT_376376 [Dissoconium aciculare CBS 342.82]